MLSWTGHKDEQIRLLATKTSSKLSGMKQNSLRIARIPGEALKSISSLLQNNSSLFLQLMKLGNRTINFII
jgi:hypothetical protein